MWRPKFQGKLRNFAAPWGCRGPKGRGSRCEAARAAIRFGGLVGEDVLKCTIAPGIGPKETPSSASFSSLFLSLPLSPPRAPAAAGCLLPMIACQGPSRIGGRLAAVFNNNKPYLLLLISPTAGAVLL